MYLCVIQLSSKLSVMSFTLLLFIDLNVSVIIVKLCNNIMYHMVQHTMTQDLLSPEYLSENKTQIIPYIFLTT